MTSSTKGAVSTSQRSREKGGGGIVTRRTGGERRASDENAEEEGQRPRRKTSQGPNLATTMSSLIGERLRQARSGRFTIDQLAKEAGVSSGRISQLEQGNANPSFDPPWKLAHALDLPMGSFFDGVMTDPGRMLVRKDERKHLSLPKDGLVYELLTPDLQRSLEVFKFLLPPLFDRSSHRITHIGEECLHLLSGSVTVFVAEQEFALEAGDSITYNSALPHSIANKSPVGAASLIAAVTPPSF